MAATWLSARRLPARHLIASRSQAKGLATIPKKTMVLEPHCLRLPVPKNIMAGSCVADLDRNHRPAPSVLPRVDIANRLRTMLPGRSGDVIVAGHWDPV